MHSAGPNDCTGSMEGRRRSLPCPGRAREEAQQPSRWCMQGLAASLSSVVAAEEASRDEISLRKVSGAAVLGTPVQVVEELGQPPHHDAVVSPPPLQLLQQLLCIGRLQRGHHLHAQQLPGYSSSGSGAGVRKLLSRRGRAGWIRAGRVGSRSMLLCRAMNAVIYYAASSLVSSAGAPAPHEASRRLHWHTRAHLLQDVLLEGLPIPCVQVLRVVMRWLLGAHVVNGPAQRPVVSTATWLKETGRKHTFGDSRVQVHV